MRTWLAAAFAALALAGCSNAPDEKPATQAAPPPASQTAPLRPAPLLDARPITLTEIDACKDAKVASMAAEQRVSVATVERRARRMQATPAWTYGGMTVTFTKTIWDSCEAAIKAARAAPVQPVVQAPAPQDPNIVTMTRLQYNLLRAEAYENPEETDPTKLRSYRAKAGKQEVLRENLEGFTPMDAFWIVIGVLVGAIGFKLIFRRTKNPLSRRPAPTFEPDSESARPETTADDFSGRPPSR